MRTKVIGLCTLLLAVSTLSGCGQKTYSYSDYKLEMNYKSDFKIMQLTDIHIGEQTDLEDVKTLLTKEVKASNPDLIVITGDTFMGATKSLVREGISYFDSWNIPFAFTYGNHDFQGDYDRFYIADQIRSAKNSMFVDYDDDDIFGQTNYYIDLMAKDTVKYRVYIVDSNSYYSKGLTHCYDIIHDDQIEHMEDIASKDTSYSVTSLAFFHIPLYEFDDAYKSYQAGNAEGNGENDESTSYGYKRTNAFDRMKACGVKGMFVGHDHINNTTLYYEDVVLSYGMKSTNEIYNQSIGYTEITLSDDSSFGLSNVKKVVVS